MRVGKTAASKVAEEPVSEWFDLVGDGPIANRLKLYARVCKHRLGEFGFDALEGILLYFASF